MLDMALVPGPLPIVSAIPVTGLLAPVVEPGIVVGSTNPSDPVDPVSLSHAARIQQTLNAPGIAMQQLGFLLGEVEQITQLTSRAPPLVMGELAAGIGSAATDLGVGVLALLPPPEKAQTPVQLAAIATLRVLGTLAPVLHHAGVRNPSFLPAVQAWREALSGASAELRPIDTSAPANAAQPSLGSASAHHPMASALLARQNADDMPVTGPTTEGYTLAVGAGPDHAMLAVDPGREAQAAARAMLRSATDTLSRMQLGLDTAAVSATAVHLDANARSFGPGYDRAWCEVQIARAQAQVAGASRAIETPRPATPGWLRVAALLNQRSSGLAEATSRHRLLARAGTLLVLLCFIAATLWTLGQLDLTLARIAAALLLALVGLAWTWWRSTSWLRSRLQIEIRR